MSEELIFQVRNHIGYIVLNRPNVLNALSYPMITGLHDQLKRWADDDEINAVCIKGAGDKAFCAGGDIRAVYQSVIENKNNHLAFFADEYKLDYYIHYYPKPYFALMDGIVMGGGMGITQGAWLRIVTDRTRMAMPETGIGFFPDVGGSYFLSRCPGFLGYYLGITGLQFRAADAMYAGLADIYLAHDYVNKLTQLLDEIVWSNNHRRDLLEAVTKAGASKPANIPFAYLQSAIDLHFSKNATSEIIESLKTEKRQEYGDWAKEILAVMSKRSPTMMCVTQEQIRRGKTMQLADCLRMELGMVHECFKDGDFVEGVRALIVDKDMQPQWKPADLDQVNEKHISRFFHERWLFNQHPLMDLV